MLSTSHKCVGQNVQLVLKCKQDGHLGQDISFDTHVDGDEGGALLVPLPEQLLRLGQRLLLHQVLKSIPPGCIRYNSLHVTRFDWPAWSCDSKGLSRYMYIKHDTQA